MSVIIQHKRGTASQWTTLNPTLAAGEVGWESNTNKFKIGTGSATWTALPYATLTPTELSSTYASLTANNTFTGTQTWNNTVYLGPGLNASVGLEIGYRGGSTTTPFIDFHSGATDIDYDSRIIASGGNGTNGQGTLTYTAATSNFTGNITTSGGITSQGKILIPGGTTIYDYAVETPGGTDQLWKKLIEVTCPVGLFTGASYEIEVVDNFENHAVIDRVAQRFRFFVKIARSNGVQDDALAASVTGPSVNYVRVVKTSSSLYEIQVRQPDIFRGVSFKVRRIIQNNTFESYTPSGKTYSTLDNGSTVGTIYVPVNDSTTVANFLIDNFSQVASNRITIQPLGTLATNTPLLMLTGSPTQNSNYLQIQNNSGSPVSSITSGGIFNTNSSQYGNTFLWAAPASTTYYLLATLPTTSAGTFDHIKIDAVHGGWGAPQFATSTFIFGNRDTFTWKHYLSGTTGTANLKVRAYSQVDGSVQIWVSGQATSFVKFAYNISSAQNITTVTNPTGTTTVPSGTVVFDSSNTTTYPPVETKYGGLNIINTTSGLTPFIIRGDLNQSVDLLQIQSSLGTTNAWIGSDYRIMTNGGMGAASWLRVGSNTASLGGGSGVIAISNATTVPNTDPTGGGILYVDTGALKYKGTSGSAATIVNADGTMAGGGSGFTGAGTSITGVQSAAGVNLPISTANNTTASGAITISSGTTSDGTGGITSGSVTIATGAGAGSGNASGAILIKTGNGSGSPGPSGSVTIDTGTSSGSGTAGTISIGADNTSGITIGRSGIATSLTGKMNYAGASSPILLNNSAGTSGQVLTSAGADVTPTWTSQGELYTYGQRNFLSGYYYTMPFFGLANTAALVLNSLNFIPFLVNKTTSFSRISVRVTAGAASSVIRLGVYTNVGSGTDKPDALISGTEGTVDSTTSGSKVITFGTALVLNPGMYWLASVPQGGAPSTTCTSNQYSTPWLPGPLVASPNTVGYAAWEKSSVSGALPNPAGTVALGPRAAILWLGVS
jgi:hypothetical protein